MTRTIQILRGTEAQNDAFTGAVGELTMDTTNNEIRIHDGSTVGGHKIGSGGSQALPLLTFMWADHQLNDVSWLRADTFSWHTGNPTTGVYKAVYAHLADDFNSIPQANVYRGLKDDVVYCRDTAKDANGEAHPYAFTSFYGETCKTVYCDIERIGSLSNTYDGPTSAATLLWRWGSGNAGQFYYRIPLLETIAGTEIRYFVAGDGHKIVMANQESNVAAIYNATGVAWYFIIDTANQRFKLPREKDDNKHHGKVIKTYKDGVRWARLYADGWVEQGGQTGNGTFLVTMADTNYSAIVSNFNQWAGNQSIGGAVNRTSVNNVTFSWGSASSSTLSWEVKGWSVYAANASSYYNGKKYLYFYVGQFTQTALENTAGLNAELFNGKADVSTVAHVVVEFQEPTAANNYTWYRKYADGWVEMGGYIPDATSAWAAATITFPIEMADTKYQLICLGNWSDATASSTRITEKTTTGATVTHANNTVDGQQTLWQVSGMAA